MYTRKNSKMVYFSDSFIRKTLKGFLGRFRRECKVINFIQCLRSLDQVESRMNSLKWISLFDRDNPAKYLRKPRPKLKKYSKLYYAFQHCSESADSNIWFRISKAFPSSQSAANFNKSLHDDRARKFLYKKSNRYVIWFWMLSLFNLILFL